ncbi:aldehyde dehydrogenase family protein [Methylobacterium sp. ID0610]|uniref:aldehyde dehydrogenase family protein n=1 Tax=Methylobacterium carpenticola TaxID=3344827 RepID=UPI003676C308
MTFDLTIDGAGVTTAATIAVVDPSTGLAFARAPNAGAAELDLAVEAARRAFPSWRDAPAAERRALVLHIADVITANAAELAELDMREGGKPRAVAGAVTALAAQWAQGLAGLDLPVEVIDDDPARRIEVHRVPVGVVGAVVPWNFPLLLSVWKLASALMAGCTVVLKPSPFAPLAVLRLGALIRPLCPPGVINVVSGDDALGPVMTAHDGFAKISFTGSSSTGRRVMASAAPTLKRLTLELGGNDAAIVFPDADIDRVAQAVFWSAMTNSGQACIATKRVYVHEAVYDRFAGAMRALATTALAGPADREGVMLGPIQNMPQLARLRQLIEDCRSGSFGLHQGPVCDGGGYFFPATIVDDPPRHSRIVREEQFGPILPLLRFSSEAEAVALVNDSDLGLTATVWTDDMERARRLARALEVGSVWVNEASALSPLVPFGGHKQSGLGVENAREGLLAYTNAKAVTLAAPAP